MRALAALEGELRTYPVRVTLPGGAGTVDGLEAAAAAAPGGGALKEALGDAVRDAKWRDALLKVGATVVLTTNLNVDAGLFNGAIGVVQELHADAASVRFRGGVSNVPRVEFPLSGAGCDDVRISHLPLRAAYSHTVDKSQVGGAAAPPSPPHAAPTHCPTPCQHIA